MPLLRSLNDDRRYEITGNRFVVARDAGADLPLDDPLCDASCHCTIRRGPIGYELWADHPTALNGMPVIRSAAVNPGDRICIGSSLFAFEEQAGEDNATRLGEPVTEGETYGAAISLPPEMKVILGRESSAQVVHLDHVQVSRRHAEISRQANGAIIRDLRSSNGTYVNHQRISSPVALHPGDLVEIGPYSFRFSGDLLTPTDRKRQGDLKAPLRAELTCTELTCRAADSGATLIEDLSVAIAPGEFVCILGPTGAGKSTLLRALANRQHATARIVRTGVVQLNGVDLYVHFEQLKQQIAFVPQHEILFDELSLGTALEFTAKLRLPADLSAAEISRRVSEVLEIVQLGDNRGTRIGSLSGGQRKRASLANELLAEPTLLFLDEVTSGLDEATDSDMMALFRRIADDGKTVICVTHTLACVPRDCDRVICLTRFGRLGFDGPPRDALEYFGVSRTSDIYRKLAVKSPDEAARMAEAFARLNRRSPASSGDAEQRRSNDIVSGRMFAAAAAKRPLTAVEWLRQWRLLLQRGALRSLLDSKANILRLVQCAIVAVLLCSVFGNLASDNSPQELLSREFCAFLLVVSSFWFGCNNAAREVVGERGIFEQERRVVVAPSAYLASKKVFLAALASLQAVLLTLVVQGYCRLPGTWTWWCALAAALATAGAGVGLAISATARTEESAIAAVPIILIPQIILAGAVAQLTGVNLLVAKWFVSSHWAFEAAKELLNNNAVMQPFLVIGCQTCLALAVAHAGLAGSHHSND